MCLIYIYIFTKMSIVLKIMPIQNATIHTTLSFSMRDVSKTISLSVIDLKMYHMTGALPDLMCRTCAECSSVSIFSKLSWQYCLTTQFVKQMLAVLSRGVFSFRKHVCVWLLLFGLLTSQKWTTNKNTICGRNRTGRDFTRLRWTIRRRQFCYILQVYVQLQKSS